MSGYDNTSETVRSTTVSTTLTNNDYVLLCSPTGGSITITVPAGSSVQPGRVFHVRRDATATNTVTVAPASGTVNGNATQAVGVAGAIGHVRLVTDGTNWFTFGSGT